MVRIKADCFGYALGYSPDTKRFYVLDKDGKEMDSATTQEGAEALARALSKQEFKRIPIVRVDYDGSTLLGALTSLNKSDRAAWVSMEKGKTTWSSGREKIYPSGSPDRYFEQTPANMDRVKVINEKRAAIDALLEEIKGLRGELEKPITRNSLGIGET